MVAPELDGPQLVTGGVGVQDAPRDGASMSDFLSSFNPDTDIKGPTRRGKSGAGSRYGRNTGRRCG
jgi:hypothetical protein